MPARGIVTFGQDPYGAWPKVTIPGQLLVKAKHFYEIRNKLIHERATVEPTDADIKNYRATIEKIVKILFKLAF